MDQITTVGRFIEPDIRLEDIEDPLGFIGETTYSGYKSIDWISEAGGLNPILTEVIRRNTDRTINCEDQCSATYYRDLACDLFQRVGQISRIVEVGVFQGGASVYLAAAALFGHIPLDLIDVNAKFLQFSFERVRRLLPEIAGNIRLFHGSLPQYVHNVLLPVDVGNIYVHHDAAHEFGQVVKDISALSFVKEKVDVLAIQDTNLRGNIRFCNFVDAAVWAVFGRDVKAIPIGASYTADQKEMTEPNRYQGNYFLPDVSEGAIIEFKANKFYYPHSLMKLEEFL